MNTRLIMSASALGLAVLGISLSFLPAEIATYAGFGTFEVVLPLQLLGALYLAFAALNWMARGSLTGGIYNRPIAVANLLHFLVGGLALGKGAAATTALPALVWGLAGCYALFATAFGLLLFRHPIRDQQQ